MANNLNLGERLRQARSFGVPSIIAHFGNLMVRENEPLVCISTGDVYESQMERRVPAFTTWGARALIAHAIACRWDVNSGACDEAKTLARTYGEMVALHKVRNYNTFDHITNAQKSVLHILRRHVPLRGDIRSLVTFIVNRCIGARAGVVVDANKAAQVRQGNEAITDQTYHFYRCGGHNIPSDIFVNAAFRTLWDNLRNPNVPWVDLANIEYELVDNYVQLWPTFDNNSILGYYEAKAIQNPSAPRALIAGAIFCYVASLARNNNMASYWITDRRKLLQDLLIDINLEQHITKTIYENFVSMYADRAPQWQEVYRQTVLSWTYLQVPRGLSVTWIIQQSAKTILTCVNLIADVVSKLGFLDATFLIRKGIPRSQFVGALTQMRDLLHNPFCSIVSPTIQLRQFSDLAYLCTIIKIYHIRESTFDGFRGPANNRCALTEAQLHALARHVFSFAQDRLLADTDMIELYREQGLPANTMVVKIENQFFEVPRRETNDNAEDQSDEEDDQDLRADEEAEPQNHGQARNREQVLHRDDWPCQARGLPDGTKKRSRKEIINRIIHHQTAISRAFNTICNHMFNAQVQIPLTEVPTNATDVPPPNRQLAVDVVRGLTEWGIAVPDAMQQPLSPLAAPSKS